MATNRNKMFEDKAFVKAYFKDAEDGRAVTEKLTQDNITINSPDLIANLVKWLNEAEPAEEDEQQQAEQSIAQFQSKSPMQESEEEEVDKSESSQEADGSDKSESSDGTSRETSSKSSLFGK